VSVREASIPAPPEAARSRLDASRGVADRSGQGRGVDVEFRSVTKRYGSVTVLDRVSLSIKAGEFVSLLGPSGSGKSTLLMILAGFEDATSGDLAVDGRSIVGIPANRRNQGVVFQSYALFPHMTVAENLAFPLTARGVPRADQVTLIRAALARVRMDQFTHRFPSELSGGQQQRVALARAIVFDPPIILMDESLSALDRRLRQQMQLELKELQRSLGKTFVYVTHDQEEAVIMSDRIAVLREGHLVQVGSPREVYDDPADVFVAGFMGDANFLHGVVVEKGPGQVLLDIGGGRTAMGVSAFPLAEGQAAVAVIRPEAITLEISPANGANDLPCQVEEAIFLGDSIRYRVSWNGRLLDVKTMRSAAQRAAVRGDRVAVSFEKSRTRIIPC
jgi:spermidine/putrescine ABC transporter ATP-binding subunit